MSTPAPLDLVPTPEHLDPVEVLSLARVLLDSVKDRSRPGALRVYRPAPTAAFGARDRFLPGFPEAVEAARTHGFTPVLRSLGGRIALYHPGSLVIDHIEPANDVLGGTQSRFREFGLAYTEVLRQTGADARLGEIPGEYCPGEYSINVAGRIKAVGTAQRVTNRGWLFSSSVVVEDGARIRAALTDIQAALGVEWNPETAGSIDEIHPGITVERVEESFLAHFGTEHELRPAQVTAAELSALGGFDGRHRV